MLAELMDLMSQEGISDNKLRKILTIDLEGQIVDEETFNTIFRYRPARPRVIQGKKGKRERKKRA